MPINKIQMSVNYRKAGNSKSPNFGKYYAEVNQAETLSIAATIITSLVTALTTSCMGYGPLAWLGRRRTHDELSFTFVHIVFFIDFRHDGLIEAAASRWRGSLYISETAKKRQGFLECDLEINSFFRTFASGNG